MCDTALDRSGRTRPEPKVHAEEDVHPHDKYAFRHEPLKEKPPSSIIQALIRVELGRKKIQESGGRVPQVRPAHVFGLIAFLAVVIGAFFISGPVGFLVLTAACLLLVLPLRDIWTYFTKHRVVAGILILLFLATAGGYCFIPNRTIKKWWRNSSLRTLVRQGKQLLSGGASSQKEEALFREGPFYFVQEFAWPGADKIKYLWPMKNQGACEEFLNRNAGGGVAGPSIAEKCFPDEGQFDEFFLRESDPEWYVTFEGSGKITNIAIFTLNDRLRSMGPESVFQNVWLFVQSALAVMEKGTPPVQLTARIFSPQGEVDAMTGKLKK
ncbi:MAG: hypothetical protein V1882_10520 [Candidatus Omnitrophota bacterium]